MNKERNMRNRMVVLSSGDCAPLFQLEKCADVGGDVWRALGDDPQFVLAAGDGGDLPGGWYLLQYRMRAIDAQTLYPAMYPDFGEGYTGATCIPLAPFTRKAELRSVIVRLDHAARSVRLDPSSAAGDLGFELLSFRRVGRLRAAIEMFSSAWGACDDAAERYGFLKKTVVSLFGGPLRETAEYLYGRARYSAQRDHVGNGYGNWLALFDQESAASARSDIATWKDPPLISIVMPTYNSPLRWLRKCIESVRAQAYPHWELCIADDASPDAAVCRELRRYEKLDPRIKVNYRKENGHISAASNSALELVTGEYVALLDHDDELHPLALYEVAKAIRANPDWQVIYSDEDKVDERGNRRDAYFKSDWNYDLLLSQNCVSHLGVFSANLIREVGGFRQGYEGSQDHDLALRCIERLRPNQIGHIPKVLYHWRMVAGSTALGVSEKDYAAAAGCRAISDHLQRTGTEANVEVTLQGYYRVRYALADPAPRVSLIIPTRDKVELLRMCVQSILATTDYPDFEILVVDNQSVEQATHDYFGDLRALPNVRVLSWDKPFNYSAINNFAARSATGQVLGLINNDIEVRDSGWLREMVGHACREGVGAVGCLLLYPDDTIQHAGVITGLHGVAGHIGVGKPQGDHGYFGRGRLVQNLSAVTAACLLVRKQVFEEVYGLDEKLEVAFNDIDFCLRLQKAGYRNVWTPHAWAYHHESASRGAEDTPEKAARFMREVSFMEQRWGDRLRRDPAYSSNLTLSGYPFELAFPPRV